MKLFFRSAQVSFLVALLSAFLPAFLSVFPSAAFAIEQRGNSVLINLSDYDLPNQSGRVTLQALQSDLVLWESSLHAGLGLRAEIFDPQSGDIASSDQFLPLSGIERVLLPTGLQYDRLALRYQSEDGTITQLDLLDPSLPSAQELTVNPDIALGGVAAISSMSTIIENGPAASRIDIVLLGDGYLSSEMGQWQTDAAAAAEAFLGESPYDGYRSYFNVHRVDTPSNESGVSHPENGVSKDTAFGSYYNCAEIQRLICSDSTAVWSTVNSITASNQNEIVIVIVNDSEYGGSGGSFAVASTNINVAELVLHETAHSFGLLADEYDSALPNTPSDCATTTPTNEPNVSPLVSLDNLKWKHWIDQPNIELPTPYTGDDNEPGLYAGSKYCQGLYRPTPNSKMRSLNRPFDPINEEALVLRIYQHISMIESMSPNVDEVSITPGETQLFQINEIQPVRHELEIKWYVDGVLHATGPSLSSESLPLRSFALTARVRDTTDKVRVDEAALLQEQVGWSVNAALNLSEISSFSDNVLTIPFVRLTQNQALYRVSMQVTSLDPVLFNLTSAIAIDSSVQASTEINFGADSTLLIEGLQYEGASYRVTLQHAPEVGELSFRLISAEQE